MTAARDAIEKAVQSLAVELTDTNLSRPDTPERTPDMPAWPLSFRPIGSTAVQSVVDVSHLTDTVYEPITPRTSKQLKQPEEENHRVGAVRIERSELKHQSQTDMKDDYE